MLLAVPIMRRQLAVAGLAGACVAAAACGGATSPDAVAPRATPALAATPAGTYALRGVVADLSAPAGAWGDTVGGMSRPAPLAGATVAIALVTRTPTTGDTAKAGTVLTPFTRLTTGADGTFTVSNIAYGYFALDISPPTGSPLRSVRAYSVSFAPGDPFRLQVGLSR